MQQISRPYQIALVVLVLAAATWFVAFGHHSSSSGGSSASSSAQTAPSQPASGSAGSSSSHIYHGSAPGVEGLTKDIAKAHAAVGTSETYARHLEEKSAQATSTNSAGEGGSAKAHSGSGASAAAPAKPAVHSRASVHARVTGKHVTTPTRPAHSRPSPTTVRVGAPTGQQQVEAAVAKGKVALILFWNPAGSNDKAVHGQVHSVGNGHSGVDVFESSAKDVASFGAITRQMPVYGTPTILIIGPHRTDSLTGLQDVFSIEQAIREVRKG
jgi:hypothetical protein